MKKTIVFGGLFLFLFAGFRPPAGMSKLPKADIDFEDRTSAQYYSASVDPHMLNVQEAKK